MADSKQQTQSLATKLAAIGNEIGSIAKSGHNREQHYNFIEYATVAGRIRELLDKYHVIIIPSVESFDQDEVTTQRGNRGYHYVAKMKFTIINGENSDETITANWLGEATDFGDKGVNKAETSGTKYFLMRLFNVSEKGDEEADASTPEQFEKSQPIHKNGVDFNEIRSRLKDIDSIDELERYWRELNLSKAQASVMLKDFSARKAELGGVE